MKNSEYLSLSWRALKTNKLRAGLTIFIISLGIGALVAIMSSIDVLEKSMRNNFAALGTNTFVINDESPLRNRHQINSRQDAISLEQAEQFKADFLFPSKVSISVTANRNAVVKHNDLKTNPNVVLMGIDDNYLIISGYELEKGRPFNAQEVNSSVNYAIIGQDIKEKLFENEDCMGKDISIGTVKYRIIGLLKSKGASRMSSDNIVMIAYGNARRSLGLGGVSYDLGVYTDQAEDLDKAIEEATGVFRRIRKLPPGVENNFIIQKSDKTGEQLLESLNYIRIATIIIGILTLIGAGIGLMNIMLVSVNERTREIGVSRAIGAKQSNIFYNFLVESILICILGGIIGVLFGIAFGNLVALMLKGSFVLPVKWIFIGMAVCFITGILAGIIPAFQASRLNPVDALRHE